MSHRDDPGQAINRRRVLATVFDPDPRGWGMFASLSARLQRGLNGTDGTLIPPAPGVGVAAYHGDSRSTPQQFMGQGALGMGLGAGRIMPQGSPDLSRETSTLLTDGPMRIYAERLKRTMGQQSVGSILQGGA